MVYLAEIILLIVNVAMAHYHSDLIKDGKKIRHGLWGAFYLAATGILVWFTNSWLLIICSLLIRKVIFDLSLNLFRNLPLFYVSTETTSLIDKLHYKLFGKKSEIYISIYFAALITINFFM